MSTALPDDANGLNAVARSALARVASFLPTAVATLLTSRLIISRFGIESFDAFILILTLISLVPLNNLGVGAAVTSAYAAEGPASERSRRVTLTAARVLTVSTLGTAATALLLSAVGAWPRLLGASSGPNLYCGVAMAVYAVSFLPGLGQSMLLGVHRNHVTVLVQTFFTPTILVGTGVIVLLGMGGDAAMLVPPAALVVNNTVTCVLAARATGLSWSWLLRSIPLRSREPGASIRAMSGPVLLITLATPIALQSDRIVLSHVSTRQAVADYSVLFQIIAPAIALIAASAQPLWPVFAEARAQGRTGPSLTRLLMLFCGGGAVLGAALAAIANPVAELIGGDAISLGVLLPVSGALAVVTAAASYPVAMSLMDPERVRFGAFLTVLALPLNIGLSIWLARLVGASGPLLATVAVGIGVQAVPGLIYSRNWRAPGRHRPATVPEPELLASARAVSY